MPDAYSKETRQQALDLFEVHGRYAVVAEMLGVSETWVSRLVRGQGQESDYMTTRERALEGRDEELRALHALGWSCPRIAQALSTSAETVRKELKALGLQRRPPGSQLGEDNPSWRGGRHIDKQGYVLLRAVDHPHANSNGYVREHRLVMERVLGRRLLPTEVVHHKDGNRQNNAPENLEVFQSNAEHLGETLQGQVPNWTPEGLERMREGVEKRAQQSRGRPSRYRGVPNHERSGIGDRRKP